MVRFRCFLDSCIFFCTFCVLNVFMFIEITLQCNKLWNKPQTVSSSGLNLSLLPSGLYPPGLRSLSSQSGFFTLLGSVLSCSWVSGFFCPSPESFIAQSQDSQAQNCNSPSFGMLLSQPQGRDALYVDALWYSCYWETAEH